MAVKQSTISRSSGVGVILLSVVLGLGVAFYAASTERVRSASEKETAYIELGNELEDASAFLTTEIRRYAVTGNTKSLTDYWTEADGNKTTEKVISRLKEMGVTPEEQAMLDEAIKQWDVLSETEIRAMKLVATAMDTPMDSQPAAVRAFQLTPADTALGADAKMDLARTIIFDDAYEAANAKITGSIEAFRKSVNARADEKVRTAETGETAAEWLLILLAVIIPVALLALLWVYHKLVLTPIGAYTKVIDRRDETDGVLRLEPQGMHELHELAAAFNGMSVKIAEAFEAIELEKAGVEKKVEDAVAASEAEQQYLARNVRTMLEKMEAMAEGDLTVQLVAEREGDDFARLIKGFNRTSSTLRNMILQVSRSAEATAGAATQISASTEELATGTEEQSSQSQEVAAAVEQMVRTILENAGNASMTAEVARDNGKVAEDGGAVMKATIAKIRQIAEVVADSASTVERLGKSSEQIGEIILTIGDIADQTNLLALNAAIEAARAGDQGRGFAVVADEVRKLAERTTQATKETGQMIRAIQNETKSAVEAMQRGTAEVNEGIGLADKAGVSLVQIVSGANKTVDMISQIAAASEEQSTTSEQIARSVDMIATVTQQSAQGVQQIARAADDLNRQTEDLRLLVSTFQTDVHELAPGRTKVGISQGRNSVQRETRLESALS